MIMVYAIVNTVVVLCACAALPSKLVDSDLTAPNECCLCPFDIYTARMWLYLYERDRCMWYATVCMCTLMCAGTGMVCPVFMPSYTPRYGVLSVYVCRYTPRGGRAFHTPGRRRRRNAVPNIVVDDGLSATVCACLIFTQKIYVVGCMSCDCVCMPMYVLRGCACWCCAGGAFAGMTELDGLFGSVQVRNNNNNNSNSCEFLHCLHYNACTVFVCCHHRQMMHAAHSLHSAIRARLLLW